MSHQFDLFALFDDPKPAPEPPANPAPAPTGEAPTRDLREALLTYASAEATWENLARHGATDEELASEIAWAYYFDDPKPKMTPEQAAALVPEVRALFSIPPQKVDVRTLPAAELLRIARYEAKAWRASGRSPLHDRINDLLDERGEAFLAEIGWPTHDDAPYTNAHTQNLTSYRHEIEQYIDPKHPENGHTRATNVRFLIEYWEPVKDPAEILPAWEAKLAAALAAKRPKPSKSQKGKTSSEPFEVTEARKAVELLKAEIARRATKES